MQSSMSAHARLLPETPVPTYREDSEKCAQREGRILVHYDCLLVECPSPAPCP